MPFEKIKMVDKKMKKIKLFFASAVLFLMPLVSLAQWNPDSLTSSNLPSSSIYDIIKNLLTWILSIFGLLAVIGFIIAGIMYIISSGDDDAMKKAKKAMTYSIIGVIVALSGLVVIFAVDSALSGESYF